ncbi:MAG: ADP-ribosylglycohydrolase family protein [Oscillospiraceae bacterium]|nr:ADP-ribosylglycohydrolase family protein [Oscillospiraceae bacterium]
MYGVIIGDIAGSTLEFKGEKFYNFRMFIRGSDITDDTIMTIAVARALMQWKQEGGDLHEAMRFHMRDLGRKYPHPLGAYGSRFKRWLRSNSPEPYNSCGNGSAMRATPCGLIAASLEEALKLAKISAEVTHNHPEGIKGAQATAAAVYLAKTRHTMGEIRAYIHENFYPMDRTCDEIRPGYEFDPTCQGSVPESIIAFLESTNFEDAIRKVISLGGDADTMGAITGGMAWAFYRFQTDTEMAEDMQKLMRLAKDYMPEDFIQTVERFDGLCADTYACKAEPYAD